ncbi:uncharacterized protein [Acropora muricata]|uniref:uncharacterized protein isoform X1 n=1 Tax=Acropora muricata TaxID=159855 RepID=UPI0034E55473
MAKKAILLCLVVGRILQSGTALVIQETRKVKVCSSSGSYTLPKSNVTRIHVSLITDSNNWTKLFIWRDPNGCFMYTETLADGTRIRCTSDGKLIVDQAAEGSPTGTYARYLFQGQLSNGSDFLQIYEVKFIECLKTRIGASISLSDELIKLIPNGWKRVDDVEFFSNNTKIAHCQPGRCMNLINVNKTRNNSWLHWTKRLNNSGGELTLTRIDERDNLRDIQARIILSSKKSTIGKDKINISLRILVESASQGPHPSVTVKFTTPQLSTFNGFSRSSFTITSQLSAGHVVTRIPPTSPTSSSADWRSRVGIVVLLLAVASFLLL